MNGLYMQEKYNKIPLSRQAKERQHSCWNKDAPTENRNSEILSANAAATRSWTEAGQKNQQAEKKAGEHAQKGQAIQKEQART